MSNIFDEVREAVENAEATINAVDANAYEMARLLRGRLRSVTKHNPHSWGGVGIIKALKRELQDFDATTGRWKS